MVKLGEILEEARTRKGLTREAAAVALKTTPPTYRAWLRGQQPAWDQVAVLSIFAEVPEGDIVAAILNEARGVQLTQPVLAVA